MALGITIQQQGNDDQVLAFKSSDVNTGMTGGGPLIVEIDDFCTFQKNNGLSGGLRILSMTEEAAVTPAMLFESVGGRATTTKSTAGRSLVEINVYEHNGANALNNITDDGNVFGIRAHVGAAQTTVWLVDMDGDTWQGGNVTAVDGLFSGVLFEATVTTLANDATPSVAASNLFLTGGTTTITDFDDGIVGQTIKILSAHAVTITDGTPIILSGGANFVMAATDTLTLTMFNDQVWNEVSRSVN